MMYPVPKPIKAPKEKHRWIPRQKDTELAKCKKIADDLCSKIVTLRAGYKCQGLRPQDGRRCNRSPVHPHHIVGRAKSLFTRFLIANNAALCDICHDHDHIKELDDMIIRLIGQPEWDRLHEIARTRTFKMSKLEFVQFEIERLKKIWNDMVANSELYGRANDVRKL
jgi:hypothetical protein